MPQSMTIPAQWLAEASVENFRPAPTQRGFRCDANHELISLVDIEVPLRESGYPLDANGFRHDRMVRLLIGIRENVSLPAIWIEKANLDQRPYRVRCGAHRYHASLTLGFSHVPAEIVERIA
jgi:hypothetical protein